MKITTHKIRIPDHHRPSNKPVENRAKPPEASVAQPSVSSLPEPTSVMQTVSNESHEVDAKPSDQQGTNIVPTEGNEKTLQPEKPTVDVNISLKQLPASTQKPTQTTSLPITPPPPKVSTLDDNVKANKPLPAQQSHSTGKVLVDAKNICKSFYVGKEETKVLKDLSVQIHEEDFLIIVGPSGSGKSTFLHILLGLEIPTTGELNFLGKDLYKDTTEDIRSEFRKQHIGMVYQQPNWIKSMSVIENIAFPLILRGYRRELAHEIAYGALQEVRMETHAYQPPTELSGGQQQRVSLARCIVHNPEIIVADEPTGNLDYESGQEVMTLLQSLNVKDKKTVIMVTHDIEYIKFANCAVNIFDGKVAGYYGKDNLEDFMSQLHTKHVNKESFIENYAQKGA